MVDKSFNKKDGEEETPTSKETLIPEHKMLAFKIVIMSYLEKNGIDSTGNKSYPGIPQSEYDIEFLDSALDVLGFDENIEGIIMQEWNKKRITDDAITPQKFVELFISEFHNLKFESLAPEYVRERNKKFIEAYGYIIKTIERIQGWFDVEIRTRVESDFRQKPFVQSTMYQCTTPFCIISLGCDQMGRYNIVYSVDYRFQEMISQNFASTLIRRVYQFTSGEMEPFVSIGSLYDDCIGVFKQIMDEAEVESYHEIIIKEKYEEN